MISRQYTVLTKPTEKVRVELHCGGKMGDELFPPWHSVRGSTLKASAMLVQRILNRIMDGVYNANSGCQ
jgi:hypothetical protein